MRSWRARGGFKRGEEVTGIQSYGDTTEMGGVRRGLGRGWGTGRG